MFNNIGPKKIKFGTAHPFLTPPSSAKNFIPEWYKNAQRWTKGTSGPKPNTDNKGLKLCAPFLDGLTQGYIAELWQDIYVEQVEGRPYITWQTEPHVVSQREATAAETMPIPAGHGPSHFVWNNPYLINTPKGYSVMVTHPLNRFDLPFTTLGGVIDSDFTMGTGQIPFFLKEGFEGTITKGTPIFQVFPFKRENWESSYSGELAVEGQRHTYGTNAVGYGYWKNNFWQKKTYN